ncbi:MAG: hypothetical protein ACREU9_01540 [Gammaproteobacteria bacterium]
MTDDLFGGWNLSRFWGRCDSRRGGQLQQHIDDPEAIEEQLRRIALRRRQRDYIELEGRATAAPRHPAATGACVTSLPAAIAAREH